MTSASPTPPSREDLAYAAGFFDGEGHIRISQHSTRCRTMMLKCTVVQATAFPVDWFCKMFGGTMKYRGLKYRGTVRPLYTWQCSSAVAERFLKAIQPYVKAKRDEIEIALKFRATFRPQHVAGGHKRMADAEIREREDMARLLKEMRKAKRAASLVNQSASCVVS